MAERNIASEVLRGLHEVREHRAGKRTLRNHPSRSETAARTHTKRDQANPQGPRRLKSSVCSYAPGASTYARGLGTGQVSSAGFGHGAHSHESQKYPDTFDRLVSL